MMDIMKLLITYLYNISIGRCDFKSDRSNQLTIVTFTYVQPTTNVNLLHYTGTEVVLVRGMIHCSFGLWRT